MVKNKAKVLMAIFLSTGMVLSGTEGTALQAEAAGKKATIKLNKSRISVKKGKKVSLKIIKKNVKKLVSVKWSAKNKKIASVSRKGKVTGKKPGKSTVVSCRVKYQAKGSAKIRSKTLKCKVTVKKKSSKAVQTSRPAQTSNPTQTPNSTQTDKPAPKAKTNQELYAMAVQDAAIAEEDEIKPLVSLTKNDKLVTWDDQGRVLLCTWHSYPDSYPEGENVTVNWGYVWTFTDKEIATYATELRSSEDAEMRLRQLIALPPDENHSTVTAMWVNPADVIRPAYQTDASKGTMTTAFPKEEEVDAEFKTWFDQNILDSYYYGDYPWTRLGYTYDWANNGKEYGLTEFLIKPGAEVEVESTKTTSEFLDHLFSNGL